MAQQEPNQQQQAPTVEIPVSKGYVDGKIAYFVATDASDKKAVESIANNTDLSDKFAPHPGADTRIRTGSGLSISKRNKW